MKLSKADWKSLGLGILTVFVSIPIVLVSMMIISASSFVNISLWPFFLLGIILGLPGAILTWRINEKAGQSVTRGILIFLLPLIIELILLLIT